MQYRIRKKGETYYPEYKHRFWPFWRAFKDVFADGEFPVNHSSEEEARTYIEREKTSINTYINVP